MRRPLLSAGLRCGASLHQGGLYENQFARAAPESERVSEPVQRQPWVGGFHQVAADLDETAFARLLSAWSTAALAGIMCMLADDSMISCSAMGGWSSRNSGTSGLPA